MRKVEISVKTFMVLIFVIILLAGCGPSEYATSNKSEPLPIPNTTPVINKILFAECIYESTGVYFRYSLFYTDQEMDAINILITFYSPRDYVNIYKGPIVVTMDYDFVHKMISEKFDYEYEPQLGCGDYPTEIQQQLSIPSLSGIWRIDFQIEDFQGNESEIISVYYERII